jgi:hypothetical protein
VVKSGKYRVTARDAPVSNITRCLMLGVDKQNFLLNISSGNGELFVGL